MEISNLLAVLGLIFTVFFGFLSIILLKKKKYPGRLILLKQSSIGLFNNIARNFSEISILYKTKPIQENVIYVKSSILNDGDIDLDGKNAEKRLELKLEPDLKWIKVKVTEKCADIQCDAIISEDNQVLVFDFGLLRKKEFFQFEALIETSRGKIDADEIYNFIKISHRIANTQKVKITSLLSEEQMERKKKKIKSFSIQTGIQFILFCLVLLFQILVIKSAPVYYKNAEGISYKIKAKSDKKIELTDLKTKKETNITLTEFQEVNKYTPFIPNQNFWEKIESAKYMFIILMIMFLILVGGEYWELRKSIVIYNIFNENKVNNTGTEPDN